MDFEIFEDTPGSERGVDELIAEVQAERRCMTIKWIPTSRSPPSPTLTSSLPTYEPLYLVDFEPLKLKISTKTPV